MKEERGKIVEEYYERILDEIIEKRLKMIGAILIVGPKWCGKTTTAKQHANSIISLQDKLRTNLRKLVYEIDNIKITSFVAS